MTDKPIDALLDIYRVLGRLEAQVKALEDGKAGHLDMALLEVKVRADRTADIKDLSERLRDKLNHLNSLILKNTENDVLTSDQTRELADAVTSLSRDISARHAKEDAAKSAEAEAEEARKTERRSFYRKTAVRSVMIIGMLYALINEGPAAFRHVPTWFARFGSWFGF